MPSRFLLVDDHALVREGLAVALGRITDQAEVVEADSCERAEQVLRDGALVDLVVLDMNLPGRSGVDALVTLRALAPAVPFVVVSAEVSTPLVEATLRAGARGYIPKASSTDVLLGALELVFAGGHYIPPAVFGIGPPVAAEQGMLTRRQEQVLGELASGANDHAIAARLGIAESTVRVHVAAILRVLRVDSREAAARTTLARRLCDARS